MLTSLDGNIYSELKNEKDNYIKIYPTVTESSLQIQKEKLTELEKNLQEQSIYLQDGMPSIYFLLTRRKEYRPQLAEYRERIMKAINNSPEWKLLSDNKAYLYSHLGLYQGISGTALAYNWMEQDKRKGELL